MANIDFKSVKNLSVDILRRFGGQLGQLDALRTRWQALVGEPMAGHSEPTHFENGRLTVAVRSAAWANRLREQQSTLVHALRNDPGFNDLREIAVRIQPTGPVTPPTTTTTQSPSHLSSRAASLVRGVAETVSDPTLRAALERLGGVNDKKNK